MRNSEMAVKNAPASGLLKLRVTTTVSATAAAPENAAPARLSVLPLATSASLPRAGDVTAGIVGHHEDEGQQQDEDPRYPLGAGISPETPGPIGEKGQIQTCTDEAAADE